jgi:hypothetical protein
MRDTIIFAGQSNTFGLGLEWELDPELNDEEYLKKGIVLPNHNTPERIPKNQKYWRAHRWTKIVCDTLGYNEYNVHDYELGGRMGGGAADTMWHIVDRYEQLSDVLDRTKYIVLEMGHIRWWDPDLHGSPGGEKLPNTPIEIDNYLKSKNPDKEVVKKAIEWIGNFEKKYFWKQTFKKMISFSEKFPDVKIILVPWNSSGANNEFENEETTRKIKDYYVDIGNYPSIYNFLTINELLVHHKAKAFNGNYKYNYREDHASVEGHKRVADFVINHIKKLENDKER